MTFRDLFDSEKAGKYAIIPASEKLTRSEIEKVLVGADVVSSGGAPTPAGTSVFTKHNWNMGMSICGLMGWAFIT